MAIAIFGLGRFTHNSRWTNRFTKRKVENHEKEYAAKQAVPYFKISPCLIGHHSKFSSTGSFWRKHIH
jgi:hypothetical protein